MPTDSLRTFADVIRELYDLGVDTAAERQWELGRSVRELLERDGFPSVAAEGFQAPGVVVSYTRDPEIASGRKFAEVGLQIAAGVPLQCDEPEGFRTFRIGLFGLDKLEHVDRTVKTFERALDRMRAPRPA